MTVYKILLERNKEEAKEYFYKQQERYTKTKNAIMLFALVGGLIIEGRIAFFYGEKTASICFIIGFVWYLLGFYYCESIWKKEQELKEFYTELDIFEGGNGFIE